ncbi:MAG: (d)CMP kinase [Fimbriimonadales bacterium]|nr:(d)CMP kinase [Fimbriimonadales bacterium]
MRVVAIDGPAGSGKSTLARQLAHALGFVYLDTGAMYRALALLAQRREIEPTDEPALTQLAQQMQLEFQRADGEQRVLLDGEDVSEAIRHPDIGRLASQISVYSGVRRALVAKQREIAQQSHGLVAEGRDTTTVVFPEAMLKIFLTASPEERARRRQAQLREQGIELPFEEVLREIRERDERDSTRADSPLRQAEDAIRIENDHLTKEQTLQRVLELYRERVARGE